MITDYSDNGVSQAIAVNLETGVASDGQGGTDTLISIERVRGSDFDDFIRGSDSPTTREFFSGDAGNDFIDGGPASTSRLTATHRSRSAASTRSSKTAPER